MLVGFDGLLGKFDILCPLFIIRYSFSLNNEYQILNPPVVGQGLNEEVSFKLNQRRSKCAQSFNE